MSVPREERYHVRLLALHPDARHYLESLGCEVQEDSPAIRVVFPGGTQIRPVAYGSLELRDLFVLPGGTEILRRRPDLATNILYLPSTPASSPIIEEVPPHVIA